MVERLLSDWETLDDAEDDQDTLSELKTLTPAERVLLERFLKALAANQERARETIDAVPRQHPFALRYTRVRSIDWESCTRVLDHRTRAEHLRGAW